MTKSALINRADVVTMIKDWQAECAGHPALHNQGNVLLDRLAAITVPASAAWKIQHEMQSLQMAEEGEFGRGYAEALAFALDAIDAPTIADEILAERERCARTVEAFGGFGDQVTIDECAANIRRRAET